MEFFENERNNKSFKKGEIMDEFEKERKRD